MASITLTLEAQGNLTGSRLIGPVTQPAGVLGVKIYMVGSFTDNTKFVSLTVEKSADAGVTWQQDSASSWQGGSLDHHGNPVVPTLYRPLELSEAGLLQWRVTRNIHLANNNPATLNCGFKIDVSI